MDAHVQAYYKALECSTCALIGGYCGNPCNGFANWFKHPAYKD